MFADWPLLSLVIWTPIVGGFLVLATGESGETGARRVALAISIITFILSIPLFSEFDRTTYLMQFVERASWISHFNVHYYLGVDGISVPLILLTTFTTVLVVIAGWEVIKYRVSQYMAAFLIMEGTMVGVFAALDAVLFYVFWEAMPIARNMGISIASQNT